MKNIILIVLMIVSISTNGQVSQPLYAGSIPNYIPGPNNQNEAVTGGILRIANVTEPRYTFYPSKAMTAVNMPLVIIFPGGGYRILAASHEGSDVAKKLNEIGVHSMVVHYRLPDSTRQEDMKYAPLQDAQQAIRVARQQAAGWNVDVNKIGVMGFSAGGHLAASAATHFDVDYTKQNDGINLRPDFQILIYPVITFRSYTHQGSVNSLLGKNKSEDLLRLFSNEEQVNALTPRAFLVHASDDKAVPLSNSLNFAAALANYNVPVDLHVMAKGGHGFGMNNKTTEENWFDRLTTWFKTF
ncbi:alpha/beta hydrolase [Aquirufa sp. 5-AUSEE-100C1]